MRARLLQLQDPSYRDFQSKLIPNVDKDTIIGVRAPQLRALAKSLSLRDLGDLPHSCFEENNLHAYVINALKDFETCVKELERFLPFVDNWATCDSLRPKCIKREKEAFLPYIRRWLTSDHAYTVRFAIEMLMIWYLDEDFCEEYPKLISEIYSNDYYVNMMIAWYFATALVGQYDAVIGYLQQDKLPVWVHNKTIQKAVESYRITKEQKAYLRTLRKKA
ncbi:MAG: DNA alkylation repair protein [Oscillospiraceae bacterium]|nr:DNA alkylation repair protein [Oscillospiraceae bacterium]